MMEIIGYDIDDIVKFQILLELIWYHIITNNSAYDITSHSTCRITVSIMIYCCNEHIFETINMANNGINSNC